MTDSDNKTAEKTGTGRGHDIQFHVLPELDYVYRDVFNVYAGIGDVTIEFGNHHKSMPTHASISNRIVMTTANAYLLVQTLQQALQQAQSALQHSLSRQKE